MITERRTTQGSAKTDSEDVTAASHSPCDVIGGDALGE